MGAKLETRERILAEGLEFSSQLGLEGVTIGALAKKVGMSKSGLYAHFESREQLQCALLDAAAARFVDDVLSPALKQPRGLPRLEAMFEHWLVWETEMFRGGCPFMGAATEFDDRPGPVRDALVGHLHDLLGFVTRAAQIAKDEGHLAPSSSPDQIAYEVWGILVAYHHFERLMHDGTAGQRARTAFESLIHAQR